MKTESVQHVKRLMVARDFLRSSVSQYTASINGLQAALDHAGTALAVSPDEEAARHLIELQAFVARLPQEARGALEMFYILAETLEVLASEVTAHEEHIPAGIS